MAWQLGSRPELVWLTEYLHPRPICISATCRVLGVARQPFPGIAASLNTGGMNQQGGCNRRERH
jgi:hypothetical protein